jgi:hypothetical protein
VVDSINKHRLKERMNFKTALIAASVLAAFGTQASAVSLTEDSYFDDNAFVYEFGAKQISAADALNSFTFTLNASDFGFSSLLGSYAISGDISGTKFAVSSIKINGTPWDLSGGSSNLSLGSLSFPAVSSIELIVTGNRLASGANFQGSLVMNPVPEPETYALMLAGLVAVGFVARRRGKA